MVVAITPHHREQYEERSYESELAHILRIPQSIAESRTEVSNLAISAQKERQMAKNRRITVAEFEAQAAAADQLDPSDSETPLLGLVGEVGSLVSALKKKRRDTDGFFGYHEAVVEELATSYCIYRQSRGTGTRRLSRRPLGSPASARRLLQ
jgi:hypothetical protein